MAATPEGTRGEMEVVSREHTAPPGRNRRLAQDPCPLPNLPTLPWPRFHKLPDPTLYLPIWHLSPT